MKRLLYENIWNNLSAYNQMVFIAGPRQAGKTTFTQMLAENFTNSIYFNWDVIENKNQLISNPYFYENVNRQDTSLPLVIFDELHKYSNWKNYIKGIYDRDKNNYKFIVSGSGRLDLYQRSGDSLAGRYLLFYLWPFTLAELAENNLQFNEFINNPLIIPEDSQESRDIWNNLSKFSGFPDPYINGSEQFYRLWSQSYKKQLLREDLRDLASLRSFDNVEILFSTLPLKISSPLSMASLARDIQVSFDSIKHWMELFERLFLVFRISPWTKKISRAITKEKKVYLYDYGGLESPSAKFENMVALELWRAAANWNNLGLGNFTLHFVRNREKEEVDFLLANNGSPVLLIETKLSDETPAKSLRKLQNVLKVPAVQLINKEDTCKIVSNDNQKILLVSASRWLSTLP
jgi:predicted AAA+ superfamily ATPase